MKKFVFTSLLFAILSGFAFSSDENTGMPVPDLSIGLTGHYGSTGIKSNMPDVKMKPGLYTGGGLAVEKMVFRYFGLGSGFQYRYFNYDFIMKETSSEIEAEWAMSSINVPFQMILSFRGDYFGLNLYGGFVYSYILTSRMTDEQNNTTLAIHKDDVMRFTNSNQLGFTTGAALKIRTTRFTHLIIGVNGEYYPTNLLYLGGNEKDDMLNMYNFSIYSGFMFRTAIFSGKK